jgi:putative lipase involved disintegration of autophagic bodies
MKKLTLLFSLFCLLIQACNSNKELSRDEALKQIKQERNFPVVIDYDFYCGDPKYGRKALDAGLESAGLVSVLKTQKLGDLNKRLVTFTDKAQPYLLPTPEKDKSSYIQRVKLADEDMAEVNNIRTNEAGNKAVVDYSTTFKNITPFAALTTVDFSKSKTNKAYFAIGDEGWKLEKKPGLDFMEFEK